MLEVRILPGEPTPLGRSELRNIPKNLPFHEECRVRESRLMAINEGDRNSTVADVSAICLINRDETKHSALDRMLGHAK